MICYSKKYTLKSSYDEAIGMPKELWHFPHIPAVKLIAQGDFSEITAGQVGEMMRGLVEKPEFFDLLTMEDFDGLAASIGIYEK